MKKISERNPLEVENSTKRAYRIAEIRQKFCNGNNAEFAQKLGFSKQYTSGLCTAGERITEKTLEKVLNAFPDVSRTWLYFGDGPMTNHGGVDTDRAAERHRIKRDDLLASYLNGHPYSGQPADKQRFLEYAIACIRDGCDIDTDAMLDSGKVSEIKIDEMRYVFSWIRNTYEYLTDNEQVNAEQSDALLVIRLNPEKKDKVFNLLFG